MGQNQGHVVYVLDDAYIHMAVAKNLAQHSVWGISQYGFSSATSSIAWPLLLAGAYLLFGPNEIASLLLNLVFATALVWVAYTILRSHKVQPAASLVALLAIVFATPLPPLIFTGLEHSLHALVTMAFVYLAARVIVNQDPAGWSARRSARWNARRLKPQATSTKPAYAGYSTHKEPPKG